MIQKRGGKQKSQKARLFLIAVIDTGWEDDEEVGEDDFESGVHEENAGLEDGIEADGYERDEIDKGFFVETEGLSDSVKEEEILEQKIGKTEDTGVHDRFDIAVVRGPKHFIGNDILIGNIDGSEREPTVSEDEQQRRLVLEHA